MQLDHDSLKFKAGTILSLAEGAGDVEAQVDIHNPGPHNHDDWLLAGVAANAIWRDDEGGKVWCWETAVIDGSYKFDSPNSQEVINRVSTFTTNLSVTIRHLIDRLNPKVAERIEVTNLHALARAICIRAGWKGRIADEHEIDAIWKDVWSDPTLGELPLPADELRREYDQVIDPNGIDGSPLD